MPVLLLYQLNMFFFWKYIFLLNDSKRLVSDTKLFCVIKKSKKSLYNVTTVDTHESLEYI